MSLRLRRRDFLRCAGISFILAAMPDVIRAADTSAKRPNILLIVSEDNGPELGCYGDTSARTPNLDKLAAEGVMFKNAYVTQAVCSPSRSSIFTGLYPHQNGQIGLATHNFAMFEKFPNIITLLKEAGYRTGIIGKVHVNPESAFPVDYRAIRGSNFNKRNMPDYAEAASKFFNASNEPFLLMINYPDAHLPFIKQQFGLPEKPQEAGDVKCMDFLGVDTPRLREHVANYYNCLSRLDTGIGMLLDKLQQSGKADKTLVMYLGDHGAQVARGKVTCYESGLRVPFIVSWPGVAKSGLVRQEMISTIDILPTFIEAASAKKADGLPGKSIVSLVKGKEVSWREYLFCERTTDSAHWHFPQRTVRDSRYKLILNMLQDRKNPVPGGYRTKWKKGMPTEEALAAADAKVQKGYKTWEDAPPVELYDLKQDPHEFDNIADNPKYAAVKDRLLAALKQWQQQTKDAIADDKINKRLAQEMDRNVGKKPKKWEYLEYLSN